MADSADAAMAVVARAPRGYVDTAREFHLATSLYQQGKLHDAEQRYRTILTVEPNHLGSLCGLGTIRRQQGKVNDAVLLFRRAASAAAGSAEAQANLGVIFVALDRADEAIACYEMALAINPDDAEVHGRLGDALRALGRPQDAIARYERALAIKPDDAVMHSQLGSALHAVGRCQDAVANFERALAINPVLAQAHRDLGVLVASLKGPNEAMRHYARALAIKPGDAETHFNLGDALRKLNRHRDAVAHYQTALDLTPGIAVVHNNLGISLQALDRDEEAIAHYRRALAIRADYAEFHNNLATALQKLRRFDEAIARYEKALAINPDHAEAHNNIGVTLQGLGRLEEAEQAYRRAVTLAPRRAEFHLNLANSRRFTQGDPRLAALEALAAEPARLSAEDRIALHFALGKAYADLEQHERAFRSLLEGNSLKRQRVAYNETTMLGLFDRIRATFTSELMTTKRHAGNPCSTPVFIIGMPRSGTTLVEQILASHSQAFGAGELNEFGTATVSVRGPGGATMAFPEMVPSLSGDDLRDLGTRYVRQITACAPAVERVADKMPSNFLLAGLIHLALPNARIIHTCRDPIDTCLSCFSILFAHDLPHTNDLGELGRYYRGYQGLMEHWRNVLPDGVMLDVQYEDVVDDLEGQARRIIAHCGLPWEDACLAFHLAQRPVLTASARQVRQPIYRSSVGRWRPYEALLQPLIRALDGEPADRGA
jgi:tetratricopeptide (TPR) repeat protein